MRRFILLVLALLPTMAFAHQSSTALLTLKETTDGLRGSVQWQLIDLEQSLRLDQNRDGELLWGEVKAMTPEIRAYVGRHLKVQQGGEACPPQFNVPLRFNNARGVMASAIVPVTFVCASEGRVEVTYTGLFSLLPEHRLLWDLSSGDLTRQGVLESSGSFSINPEMTTAQLNQQTFSEFFVQGIIHILLGPDHVAFLLTLLLVSVLVQQKKDWQPAADVRTCVKTALLYVTTFTIAHSLTLSASALGWLALPGYWVELIIAASVVVAALHNLRPYLPASAVVVFLFGLVHGFGFASVLGELTTGTGNIVWALFGFNLGVEAGQVAITLVVMPLLISLRRLGWYRKVLVRYLSAALAVLGSYWVLARI